MNTQVVASPLGPLRLCAVDGRLRAIDFDAPGEPDESDDPVLCLAARQLREWFAGSRRSFDLQLDPRGTPFQHEVWHALAEIPFGETRTYADVARAIGRPAATRAVGAANGRNPLPVVVPCHRVIGSDGSLTGFGGGLDRKRWLLSHEAPLFIECPNGVRVLDVGEPGGRPGDRTRSFDRSGRSRP